MSAGADLNALCVCVCVCADIIMAYITVAEFTVKMDRWLQPVSKSFLCVPNCNA